MIIIILLQLNQLQMLILGKRRHDEIQHNRDKNLFIIIRFVLMHREIIFDSHECIHVYEGSYYRHFSDETSIDQRKAVFS